MPKRNSIVNNVNVTICIIGGVIQIGDSKQICANSRAIALQRQKQLFYGHEVNFDEYPIFSEPIPIPPIPSSLPALSKVNQAPNIHVNRIKVIGVSTSGILHIGSSNCITNVSRVLHIRQYSNPQLGSIRREE